MVIIISMALMVIEKWIASKRRNLKVEKDLINPIILMAKIRIISLVMLLRITQNLIPFQVIGLLIQDTQITCVSKRISLKILTSIEKMQ